MSKLKQAYVGKPYKEKRFSIPPHTLDRARERHRDAAHLHDEELRRSVEDCIISAYDAGQREKIDDKGEPMQLVDLRETSLSGLFALVHAEKRPQPGLPSMVCRTLLTSEQVERNKASPDHGWEYAGSPNVPINSLAGKLPLLTELTKAAAPPAPEPAALVTPTTLAPKEAEQLRLISYFDIETKRDVVRLVPSPAAAALEIEKLVNEDAYEPEMIIVLKPTWSPVRKRVSVVVE